MLDETKRKELIEDAQQKLFEPIDDFLKYLVGVTVTEKIVTEIANKTQSVFVDSIGKILILFKPSKAKDAKITPEFNEFKKKKRGK